jgi:hypothetical protein
MFSKIIILSTFLHYRHLVLLHLSQCARKLTTVMPPGCLASLALGGGRTGVVLWVCRKTWYPIGPDP